MVFDHGHGPTRLVGQDVQSMHGKRRATVKIIGRRGRSNWASPAKSFRNSRNDSKPVVEVMCDSCVWWCCRDGGRHMVSGVARRPPNGSAVDVRFWPSAASMHSVHRSNTGSGER